MGKAPRPAFLAPLQPQNPSRRHLANSTRGTVAPRVLYRAHRCCPPSLSISIPTTTITCGLLDGPGGLVLSKILAHDQAITRLLPGVLRGLVICCCFWKILGHIQTSPWLFPWDPGGYIHAGPAHGGCPPYLQESKIKSRSLFKISRDVKGLFLGV